MYRRSYDLGIGAKGLEQPLLGGSFSSLADGLLCSPIPRSCWAGEALRDPCTKKPMLSFKINQTVQPRLGELHR